MFARALAGDDTAHLALGERVLGPGSAPDPQAARAVFALAELTLVELDRAGCPVPHLSVAEADQQQAGSATRSPRPGRHTEPVGRPAGSGPGPGCAGQPAAGWMVELALMAARAENPDRRCAAAHWWARVGGEIGRG